MSDESVSVAFLDQLYADTPDPWNLAGSDYEAEKYAATLAALPRPFYKSGIEIGCSIGVLTALLAKRCGSLLAIDPAEAALAQARERNAKADNIVFRRAALPHDELTGRYGLIVLSEVLYFMSTDDVARTARQTLNHAEIDADLILVNWLAPSNLPLTGDVAVHSFLGAVEGRIKTLFQARNGHYRLDVLRVISL